MSIGENIKKIRKSKEITQEALANEVGITRPMLAQIERGTKAPSLPLAIALADELHCSVYDFITGKERG